MLTLNHVLLLLGVGAVRVLVLLVSPVRRRCTWCKGTLRARRHRWWGRAGHCPHCDRGRHPRLGATTVHKARQAILADIRERRSNR